ncbi:MAG TPA: transposase [Candidatus Omnitrophota bacterium]|nr:transposase [Candidatus Omnitrophota bacterium]HPD84172.1 transposase [Candidatus Omnitrophota bacterium]HRZ03029.1 transposase [Candidatus Omnitrophota bacterium]
MARIARVVALDTPHHVVQRGNRRQNVFLKEEDKQVYLDILKEQCRRVLLEVWAYCLMDNHVHLIVVPRNSHSLAKGIGETHRRYTRLINFREGWRGYLWQGRFSSFPLDEKYLFAAVRYVERNPVRAKIVQKAEDYSWSSAKARIGKTSDLILDDFYLTHEITNWSDYLRIEDDECDLKYFRRHGQTGRPLGEMGFIRRLEESTGVRLTKQKPGPKLKN